MEFTPKGENKLHACLFEQVPDREGFEHVLEIIKTRHDLAILIGLLSLEEMSEAVSGKRRTGTLFIQGMTIN